MLKDTDIVYQLKTKLKEYGAECKIVSASNIPELKSDYDLSLDTPYIDKSFIRKCIKDYIDFSVIEKHPSIQSIVIVATPSPGIEIGFSIRDTVFYLKIPPHYPDRIKVTRNIKNITSQLFDRQGYQTFSIVLPKKLLAVRSGLARYGRNNLTYVPGMGSYHRLTVFASDLPCREDSWQNIQMVERCSHCKACLYNCPTAAITTGRFLIKAERCLTYYNEREAPFPKWVDPKSYNSLIGCMRCQINCPENKEYKSDLENREIFSPSETNLILNQILYEELPEIIQQKISRLSLKRYYDRLSRNIKVLIENELNRITSESN